ncbi:glycosyltransferase [Acinetobacter indicus]|uniref:glycosyltransferase n=1 Tax=Acinetobacter indicus TaxID=756892 RepID=UPI0020970320|nr:glycosyltransferase [Acinetobacter indicus]
MKIVHIITGLNNGGAEGVLYRLVINDKENEHIVVSMMDAGKYGPLLIECGIQVICLEMSGGRFSLSSVIQLYKKLKLIKPDIIQTWMYHADLIGGVVGRIAGVKRIFWNIRHSTFDPTYTKKSTIIIAKLCGKLSSLIPEKIICCAESAVVAHLDLGYSQNKIIVINNGYDLLKFRLNYELKENLCQELGLKKYPILGMVGRYDPQKNHIGLIDALKCVKNSSKNFYLILVGKGLNSSNIELVEYINKAGLAENVYLLDQRNDIDKIMNSLDIHILSSSYGEGFPNVIAEAMACGTPCVATDVGEAKRIIEKDGWIVEPNNIHDLAEKIIIALDEMKNIETWDNLKLKVRKKVLDNYDINKMITKYNTVWNGETCE